MQSVSILTFSGTGNTQFVVDALLQSLTGKGMAATSIVWERLSGDPSRNAILAADVIGIAFPVHAFNPPPLVEKLARQLPVSPRWQDCFILKTSASPFAYGGTTTGLKRILRAKQLRLRQEFLVPMPANFAQRYADDFIKLNLKMALHQVERIAGDLIEGKKRILPALPQYQILSSMMLVERLGARLFGHHLKAGPSCTQCGLCARDCPTRNIRLAGGSIRFGWNCTFCMRCSFRCPVQAISHQFTGRALMIKPPYDLKGILADPEIKPIDIDSGKYSYLKEFRNFYRETGII